MKFAVCSTVWCHWTELDNLIDRYPMLYKYNFRTAHRIWFNPTTQETENIKIGYIDVQDLTELIELMEAVDEELIVGKNGFGDTCIEIYDGFRE